MPGNEGPVGAKGHAGEIGRSIFFNIFFAKSFNILRKCSLHNAIQNTNANNKYSFV